MKKIKPTPPVPCHCPACTGALFHMPPPVKQPRTQTTKVARYARYKPKVRTLCDDCISDIHYLGMALAPLPAVVRWRRTDSDGVTHLCHRHKEERQAQE